MKGVRRVRGVQAMQGVEGRNMGVEFAGQPEGHLFGHLGDVEEHL